MLEEVTSVVEVVVLVHLDPLMVHKVVTQQLILNYLFQRILHSQ